MHSAQQNHYLGLLQRCSGLQWLKRLYLSCDTLALDQWIHLFIAVSVLEWQRLVLSSWSKGFSRSPEKIFRAVDVQLSSSETHFHLRPTARVFVLVRMRRIAVVVVAILFRRHASDKFQDAISWSITWIFVLHCLYLKYVVPDHFRWGIVPVNQNKLKICLHFGQIRPWQRCLKLSFFGLHVYVKSLNCSIPFKQWLKSFLRDHWPLQQFRADILSTFFKREALTFSSAC